LRILNLSNALPVPDLAQSMGPSACAGAFGPQRPNLLRHPPSFDRQILAYSETSPNLLRNFLVIRASKHDGKPGSWRSYCSHTVGRPTSPSVDSLKLHAVLNLETRLYLAFDSKSTSVSCLPRSFPLPQSMFSAP